MASGGGPKPRKKRSDPNLRAFYSMPKQSRRIAKKAYTSGGMTNRAAKQSVGSRTRRSHKRAGRNPNTGLSPHQHIKSKVGGSSSKAQVRKVTRKVIKRAAASGKYSAPLAKSVARKKARRIIRARRK